MPKTIKLEGSIKDKVRMPSKAELDRLRKKVEAKKQKARK